METLIAVRGVTEEAKTDLPIPLNSDGSVDYGTYIARTTDWWPVRGKTDRVREVI
jgi:hypothetical protein